MKRMMSSMANNNLFLERVGYGVGATQLNRNISSALCRFRMHWPQGVEAGKPRAVMTMATLGK